MNTGRLWVLIFVSFFIQSADAQGPYDRAKLYSPDLLKSDFRFLRTKLETIHPALYRYTSRNQFDLFFDSLYQSFSRPLIDQQFLSVISLLNQKIKDGHTMFLPGQEAGLYNKNDGRLFPFSVSWINDKLYVRENLSTDTSIVKGFEIIRINGVDAHTLMSQLMVRQIRDGYSIGYPVWILSNYFAAYYSFAFGQSLVFSTEFKNSDGRTLVKNVNALSLSEMQNFQRIRYRIKHGKGTIRLKTTAHTSTALLKIETFDLDFYEQQGMTDYKDTLNLIFLKLKQEKINNLILDLRDNEGGDFEPARTLLSYLIEKPCQFLIDGEESALIKPNVNHFTGRILLLMNGGSFSATSILISTLNREHRAVLIGEETGGNRNIISGDAESFILPHTHINCLISTKNYQIQTGANDGHGVIPDHFVPLTIDDLIYNKDPAIAFALSLP